MHSMNGLKICHNVRKTGLRAGLRGIGLTIMHTDIAWKIRSQRQKELYRIRVVVLRYFGIW